MSYAGLLLALVAAPVVAQVAPAPDVPPEVAQGQGPRGTSGEVREDGVGYAAEMSLPPEGRWNNVTIGVAHATIPLGSAVEVTALDTGRTIIALVVARESGALVALSPGAAQALGVGEHAAVRVRTVVASPQDERALVSGQAASARLDAPPALLTALRRRVQGPPRDVAPVAASAHRSTPLRPVPVRPEPVHAEPVLRPAPVRPAPVRPAPVRPAAVRAAAVTSGFVVQVAALSASDRAAALARQLGGHVVALGKLYRVQLGPFADRPSAQRARDGAARLGYADAHIFHTD